MSSEITGSGLPPKDQSAHQADALLNFATAYRAIGHAPAHYAKRDLFFIHHSFDEQERTTYTDQSYDAQFRYELASIDRSNRRLEHLERAMQSLERAQDHSLLAPETYHLKLRKLLTEDRMRVGAEKLSRPERASRVGSLLLELCGASDEVQDAKQVQDLALLGLKMVTLGLLYIASERTGCMPDLATVRQSDPIGSLRDQRLHSYHLFLDGKQHFVRLKVFTSALLTAGKVRSDTIPFYGKEDFGINNFEAMERVGQGLVRYTAQPKAIAREIQTVRQIIDLPQIAPR